MRLSRHFQDNLFFTKRFYAHKNANQTKNQLTKQKQANKKQERQQFVVHKIFLEEEHSFLCALLFFVRSKSFLKKNRLS